MDHIYSHPLYYEIGFVSDEDVAAEVKFSLRCYAKHRSGVELKSVIDNGCGTGCHLGKLAESGLKVCGYDASPQMVDYANRRTKAISDDIRIFNANLNKFETATGFDMAVCFNGSFQYLITNDDVVSHLKCVGKAMNPGGLYLITLPAPQDFITNPPGAARYRWSRISNGITVRVNWTYHKQSVDWDTQTFSGLAKIDVVDNKRKMRLWMPYRYRIFFPQELRALVKMSECFEIVEVYNGYNLGRPYSGARQPTGMNLLLREVAKGR